MYQPTSWEYIQFLYLANNGQNAFLASEGMNLLNAWLNTGMAEPMLWPPLPGETLPLQPCITPGTPQNLKATAGKKAVTLNWEAGARLRRRIPYLLPAVR